jgi:hypothetical protein
VTTTCRKPRPLTCIAAVCADLWVCLRSLKLGQTHFMRSRLCAFPLLRFFASQSAPFAGECMSAGLVWALLAYMVGVPCILHMGTRQAIRKKYNLKVSSAPEPTSALLAYLFLQASPLAGSPPPFVAAL